MFTLAQRKQALQHRRERFIQHIKAGRTLAEIAEREGVDEKYAKDVRKEIAAEEGLTIWQPPKPTVTERAKRLPYGMTSSSNKFRMRLGNIVHRLIEFENNHPIDISAQTGVNQKALKTTHSNPSIHNWTLAQIERLAELEGKDFVTLMRELLEP